MATYYKIKCKKNKNIPRTSGIYQIVNTINQKRYIGYASNLQSRINSHIHDLTYRKHGNDHLQKAWNKYGRAAFEFSTIEICTLNYIYYREHYWSTILDVHNREKGYNIEPTDPYKKITNRSQETRNKISKANTGRKLTQEHIDYLVSIHKGRQHSLEEKEKRLKSLKASGVYERRKETKGIKVINTQTGKIYATITEAAEAEGIPKPRLAKYLKGTRTNKSNCKYL